MSSITRKSGPNKLIAKLASDRNKPDGLTVVKSEDVAALLEDLPVEELCGIGDKTKAKLQLVGIKTCGELGRAPVNLLRVHFGIIGEVLSLMGQGIDNSPVVPLEESPEAKSIGHSMTLEKDETNIEKLKMHLLQLSEMVGRRLRAAGFCGKTICLTIRYRDFQTFTKQRTIKEFVNSTNSIYNEALKIFNSIIDGSSLPRGGLGMREKEVHMLETKAKRQKSWQEKLEDNKGLPKVEKITEKMSKRWGSGTVVIPAPKEGKPPLCVIILRGGRSPRNGELSRCVKSSWVGQRSEVYR